MNPTTSQPKVKTGTPPMLIAARTARILVGIVFIFSGLIKLNDPVGTQIKFEEYFEVFAQDIPFLHDFFMGLVPFTLVMSVLFCAAEVILGVALLASYKPKITVWLLFFLIIFFTFLTFYSAYFDRVTDCGCFGDAIKLKPWTSFGKDVVLTVLILFIIGHRNRLRARNTGWLVALTTVLTLALGVYAVQFLPPIDMLPYAVGKSIPTQMKPSEPLRYKYIMERAGQTVELDKYPTDQSYKFKEMVLVNESAKPKITDYRVWDDSGDYTQQTFEGKKLFIIIKNTTDIDAGSLPAIRELVEGLQGSDIKPYILTSTSDDEIKAFRKEYQLESVPYYKADATVLKTIMRSNPGTWLMDNGVVRGKWHYNSTPEAEEVKQRVKE
ncbi:DoxX family membrane protein [Spirosoma sp. BT702]|uniref:DoxX family membrane protein n=1 Tax=Spirosoma profusum TaxID=2771354 RepID=A0A927G9T7_9BACT|nr:BT_3928 family protein [Spirosoma profusum]MBD2704961.1 DoxX family membrane protein [Spirosoma profusum]